MFACFWLCVLLLLCNGESERSSELVDDLKIHTHWRDSENLSANMHFIDICFTLCSLYMLTLYILLLYY